MKRFILITVVFLLFALMIPLQAVAERTAKVIVDSGSLNMREGNSTKSKTVIKIPKGKEVVVIEENGEWSKIKYKGKTGYAKTRYLLFLDESKATIDDAIASLYEERRNTKEREKIRSIDAQIAALEAMRRLEDIDWGEGFELTPEALKALEDLQSGS